MKKTVYKPASEHELCEDFISQIDKSVWTVYPETCGFDMVLERKSDGFQIAIEAKLRLNAKVIAQVAEHHTSRGLDKPGPDCRAVLVPQVCGGEEFRTVVRLLNIVVIRLFKDSTSSPKRPPFVSVDPSLPDSPTGYSAGTSWPEFMPTERLPLPEYISEVPAGVKSPKSLTAWKIKAAKIIITLSKRGYVTRQDFKALQISMSLWTQSKWIVQGPVRGRWVSTSRLPDIAAQHPKNFTEIEADWDKWKTKELVEA